jgi:hypothetical protein
VLEAGSSRSDPQSIFARSTACRLLLPVHWQRRLDAWWQADRRKPRVWRWARNLAILLFLNQIAYPAARVLYDTWPSTLLGGPYAERPTLPADAPPLDCLFLASSLVHQEAKGEGNCRDYVYATFRTYMAFAAGRPDRERSLRMAASYEGGIAMSHTWLEMQIGRAHV